MMGTAAWMFSATPAAGWGLLLSSCSVRRYPTQFNITTTKVPASHNKFSRLMTSVMKRVWLESIRKQPKGVQIP